MGWFFEWLMGRSEKPTVETVPKPVVIQEVPVDKVRAFNFKAPQIFSPHLRQYGYHIYSFCALPGKGWINSSYHSYINEDLKKIITIEQAPYYTDYGFSIFLINTETQEKILLCNVPGELQDGECEFMRKICQDFFSNHEVISLIEGREWQKIKPLGLQ